MNDYQIDTRKEIGYRLNAFRKSMGISQKELAQLVNANQGNVSNVINGLRDMPKIWTYKLREKYARLNEEWIYTGEGDMLKSENKQEYKYLIFEDPAQYLPSKDLSRKELERMVMHLWYRVGELEAWRREMEGRVEVGEGKGGKKK